MSNNIVEEENPNQPQPSGGAQDKIRKQARQLAYDVRYKVKGQFKDGQKSDPASLKRAYMSQLGKSPASGPVRQLAKKMLVGESYDFIDLTETASNAVADAIKKVFVKTIELDDADGNPAYEITDLSVKEEVQEKKYKVRVTDKKTGKSYTRMADRSKISELRKNPNISSVEMTGYGTPYEGEKKKGSQTAAVKSGKGLAKKDYDGDGKRESSSKEHAGSVHNAIQRKKGGIADGKDTRKEEFIGEVLEKDNGTSNEKKVDVMKGKNKITINPTQAESVDLATGDKKSDSGIDAKQKRVAIMKRQILQRKMQAVRGGAGADIVAHTELEGEVIEEGKKKGLWDNIHAKRKRGEKPAKPGDKDYPKTLNVESLKQARKNVGADTCWDGYKAKGTKKKNGKEVPNCVKVKEDAQYGYDKDGKSLNPKDKEEGSEKKVPTNSVVFDGGTTIEPIGDSRENPTIINLVKNRLRARGLYMSYEPKGQLVEQGIEDIIARLEKKRISKGGDPDKSPLGKKTGQAMKAKQDAARKKAGVKTEGYQRDPERQEKERKTSKQTDPSKDNFTGISGSIATIMKQNAAMKKAAAKKVKKEELDPMVQSAVDALNRYSTKKQ